MDRYRLLLMFLILTLCPLIGQAQQAVSYRYTFAGADSILIKNKVHLSYVSSGNDISGYLTTQERLTITNLPDGNFTYRLECLNLDRSKLHAEFKLDNFQILKPGQIYEAVIDSRGRIVRVVQNPVPRFLPFIVTFPEKTVHKGDHWTSERGGKLHIEDQNRSVVDQEIKILWTLDQMAQDGNRPVVVFLGTNHFQQGNDVQSKLKAKMLFDERWGMISRGRLDLDFDLSLRGKKMGLEIRWDWEAKPEKKKRPAISW